MDQTTQQQISLASEHIREMREALVTHRPASMEEVIVDDETMTERTGAAIYFCLETELRSLRLQVSTTWWKPDDTRPEAWARSVVASTDPHRIMARYKDYPLPVSRGGLTEAHRYLVEEAKAGRYPDGGAGPIAW